jgi:hypothetical protein
MACGLRHLLPLCDWSHSLHTKGACRKNLAASVGISTDSPGAFHMNQDIRGIPLVLIQLHHGIVLLARPLALRVLSE